MGESGHGTMGASGHECISTIEAQADSHSQLCLRAGRDAGRRGGGDLGASVPTATCPLLATGQWIVAPSKSTLTHACQITFYHIPGQSHSIASSHLLDSDEYPFSLDDF